MIERRQVQKWHHQSWRHVMATFHDTTVIKIEIRY